MTTTARIRAPYLLWNEVAQFRQKSTQLSGQVFDKGYSDLEPRCVILKSSTGRNSISLGLNLPAPPEVAKAKDFETADRLRELMHA